MNFTYEQLVEQNRRLISEKGILLTVVDRIANCHKEDNIPDTPELQERCENALKQLKKSID